MTVDVTKLRKRVGVADLLRPLSRARLEDLAGNYTEGATEAEGHGELAARLAREAGDSILEMLTELEGAELRRVAGELGITVPELAQLAAPPAKREHCEAGLRPCPYRRCRFHWGERRTPTAFCVLDVIDEDGPQTLKRIGELAGLSRERIRQVEADALAEADRKAKQLGVDLDLISIDFSPESGRTPVARRKLAREHRIDRTQGAA